ncbi:antirestriction protein ArdA [Hoeflea sp. G2-23]|uniref:Antirestriction protein ArdA n=1 Tax=Hoeflea algicola TaxID=2983763 RepID=A0ABT3ZCH4_9HYPH|nr:antirestriction protein ArdA [Hoeflea algicola]MCY0149343.1 antirestriction protein ArdA [Hoeflea algicola]
METQAKTETFTHGTRFYAQPYDIMACGFFFESAEDYTAKRDTCRNAHGQVVEEFEIQFIDGDGLDEQLFDALSANQATIIPFMDRLETWEDWQKKDVIVAVGECGYSFNFETDDPDDLDVDLYTEMTLSDLAYQFVDEGLFGDIPASIANYIDYDAIARDLGMDYTEITIAGETCVYRCG